MPAVHVAAAGAWAAAQLDRRLLREEVRPAVMEQIRLQADAETRVLLANLKVRALLGISSRAGVLSEQVGACAPAPAVGACRLPARQCSPVPCRSLSGSCMCALPSTGDASRRAEVSAEGKAGRKGWESPAGSMGEKGGAKGAGEGDCQEEGVRQE